MLPDEGKTLEGAIVRAQGTPQRPEVPHERTRWRVFLYWILRHLKIGERLAQAYAEGKVAKETTEANRTVEEAAKIAAEREFIHAKTDLIRQKEFKMFSANVDEIYKDDSLPLMAKLLKLAKLFENNPEILERLEEVKETCEKLSIEKNVHIEILGESQSALEDGDDSVSPPEPEAQGDGS